MLVRSIRAFTILGATILSFVNITPVARAQEMPRAGSGACCDPASGACTIRDQASCVSVGGAYQGDNSTCDACNITAHSVEVFTLEDTFELQAAPERTYGFAGALSVAGSTARNRSNQVMGVADTWIKFNTGAAITVFNNLYGAGNWDLVSVDLVLHENNAPQNNIFGKGTGLFSVRWLANDNWSEGTGTPNSPGTATGNRIGFTYGRSLLNASLDEVLGTTYSNNMQFAWHNYALPLLPGFKADLRAGGVVSLYLTAVEPQTGFTFNSGTHSYYAHLLLTADVVPSPPSCRGDGTGDDRIRGDDIQSFVDDYLNAGALPPADRAIIDMTGNGVIDSADLACFVAALLATHDCGANGLFVCP